jgi:heme-degrading monooxygenase HmoA
MIAQTPETPYYVVLFTTIRTNIDEGYDEMAIKMEELAAQQPGYLGIESARDGVGITASYWKDLESIRNWKNHVDHTVARELGREKWYEEYMTRIAKVEHDYGFKR